MATCSVISLYTGAGGMDYGFESAGFDVRVAVEMDADCCATLASNRQWPIISDDIRRVTSTTMLDMAGCRKGELDVLIGGPPCQPFSKAAYGVLGGAQRLHDPRAYTLVEMMRCVGDMLPRVFCLENVHGIAYAGKHEGMTLIEYLTREINRREGVRYALSWRVLNAADYGVPQTRVRVFIVGHREGTQFVFPSPTHGDWKPLVRSSPTHGHGKQLVLPWQTHGKRRPYVTAWDAIGDYRPPEHEDLRVRGRYAALLPSIPEGCNYLWHTHRGGGLPLFGWRTRYGHFLRKLAKHRPSWTILAHVGSAIGPFHWDNRRLSVEELARLQTFPKDLTYHGSRASIQRQIGNAVPSLMAEILAREIRTQLLAAPVHGRPRLEVISCNQPIPPAESIQSVPDAFLIRVRQ